MFHVKHKEKYKMLYIQIQNYTREKNKGNNKKKLAFLYVFCYNL